MQLKSKQRRLRSSGSRVIMTLQGALTCSQLRREQETRERYQTTKKAAYAYMLQKTKALWVQEGDENPYYFHSILKKRNYQARISTVCQQGVVIDDKVGVLQHFLHHYEQPLGTPALKTWNVKPEVLNQGLLLPMSQQVGLLKPFTAADVKQAIFSIHNAKSHGHDGYSGGKQNWNVIGSDVSEAVLGFFQDGKLLKELNHTVLVLLTKTEQPKNAQEYRPIACCTVLYKIISK